jgi:hypothetical protein
VRRKRSRARNRIPLGSAQVLLNRSASVVMASSTWASENSTVALMPMPATIGRDLDRHVAVGAGRLLPRGVGQGGGLGQVFESQGVDEILGVDHPVSGSAL